MLLTICASRSSSELSCKAGHASLLMPFWCSCTNVSSEPSSINCSTTEHLAWLSYSLLTLKHSTGSTCPAVPFSRHAEDKRLLGNETTGKKNRQGYLQVLVCIASFLLWSLECLQKGVFAGNCNSDKLRQLENPFLWDVETLQLLSRYARSRGHNLLMFLPFQTLQNPSPSLDLL